jgi:anti-sigma factor RsiW
VTDHELTCRELVELVTDHLECALSEEDRGRVEAHLAECEDCALYAEHMRLTVALLGRLWDDDLPVPVADVVLDALRSADHPGDHGSGG